ncbi:MAG: hypothetical protein J0I48_10390 [Devosia sp.]|nr:hypothetical protein [Devosia sp.]
MRITHFETLRPVCPVCRLNGLEGRLKLTTIEAETGEDVQSGILSCALCGSEFPILDGMPVIVPEVRRFVQDNLFYLMARTDLTPAVESLLGDAAGPGSGLESIRQHVSSYAWDHWGDHDPAAFTPVPGGGVPGAVSRNLAGALDMLDGDLPEGPVLDIGCAAGRTVTAASTTACAASASSTTGGPTTSATGPKGAVTCGSAMRSRCRFPPAPSRLPSA